MMFRHVYFHRLKISIRDRQMLFWTFLFPLILATFFGMAFANLTENEIFRTFPIGVVDNEAYRQDKSLQAALNSASDSSAQHQALFTYNLFTEQDAQKALVDKKIIGYLIPKTMQDETISIVVNDSGIRQTILKIFIDEYLQLSSAVDNIVSQNPQIWPQLAERIEQRIGFIEDRPVSEASPETTIVYFYALIAMACLYGGSWGLKEVIAIQANLSAHAARINLVPVNKMKVFFASILAALTVQYATMLLLIAYLRFVIGISFGNQTGLLLLASLSGSLFGITIGCLAGAASKASENLKEPLLIGFSLFSAFLAGLMIMDIKPMIMRAFPPVSFINPASIISDTFYALYFYDNLNRFFSNIILQTVYSLILIILVFLIMRRRRYASI